MEAVSLQTVMGYIEDGGPPIMWTLVGLFVVGLTITLWRLVMLLFAMIGMSRIYSKVFDELSDGDGVDAALALCADTPGPVATILHAGLCRINRGLDEVEKAVNSAGAVEMAFLESGLVWLATIANIAPMIGFFGTVAGMIKAFRDIAAAGDVIPAVVAEGISIALITTAGGLLVAIPMQLAYNLCVWLIDRIVVRMEEQAAKFIDLLTDLGYE